MDRWRCFSKIVTFSRSNDINALVSGDIQFDQTSPDKVIHSAPGGFPVRMVMATTRGLNLALAVQPAIKSAADLKGKSVAVTSFSGVPYTGLLLCLKELGMSKEQVMPLNIGGKSARFEALLHGRVAAAILDPPYTTMATKAGYKLLVDLAPLDVPYLRKWSPFPRKRSARIRRRSRDSSRHCRKACAITAIKRTAREPPHSG